MMSRQAAEWLSFHKVMTDSDLKCIEHLLSDLAYPTTLSKKNNNLQISYFSDGKAVHESQDTIFGGLHQVLSIGLVHVRHNLGSYWELSQHWQSDQSSRG